LLKGCVWPPPPPKYASFCACSLWFDGLFALSFLLRHIRFSAVWRKIIRGVYFSVWPPPGEGGKYGQITCWGKIWLKRDEKRMGNSYFSPIYYKHTNSKIKKAENVEHPLIIINFIWGENMNQGGGGGKNLNFKRKIHLGK